MLEEIGGYRVGQYGLIDVLDSAGKHRCQVEGEIVKLIPTPTAVYALVRTPFCTAMYRVW